MGTKYQQRGQKENHVVSLTDLIGEHHCFSSCPHNLWLAVVGRIQTPLLKAYEMRDRKVISELKPWARQIGRSLFVDTWSPARVIGAYSGMQKSVYERAFRDFPDAPEAKHAKVSYFVKVESYEVAETLRTPRPIAPRHPAMRAHMARYLKPIEHAMVWANGLDNIPFLGKGLDQAKLAERHLQKMAEFEDPVVICLDASKFDGHVVAEMLDVENECWAAAHRYDPLFMWMLKKHRVSEGWVGDQKARHVGARASGDQQTGIGNSLLSHLMIKHTTQGYHTETLCNGDDANLYMERRDWAVIEPGYAKRFEAFGMEMKIGQITDDPYAVEWCQCTVVRSTPPCWVRNPERILNTLFRGTRYGGADTYERMLSIVRCELALAKPSRWLTTQLQKLERKLAGFKESKAETLELSRYKLLTASKREVIPAEDCDYPVTDEVRARFELAVDEFQPRPLDEFIMFART